MTNKNYSVFLRFCKDNDLIDYIKDWHANGFHMDLLNFDGPINQVFNKCITWNYTVDGFDFWYDIHLKWQFFCFENKIISKYILLSELHFSRGHEEVMNKYKKIWENKYGST